MADQANNDETFQRDTQNNTRNIRNATDALASKGPGVVGAAAKAAQVIDKGTGGKFSEKLGEATTKANRALPGGNIAQGISNRAPGGSGVGSRIANGIRGNRGGDSPNQVVNRNTVGGGQDSSLPSSASIEKRRAETRNQAARYARERQQAAAEATSAAESEKEKKRGSSEMSSAFSDDHKSDDKNKDEEQPKKGIGRFLIGAAATIVVIALVPILVVILIIFMATTSITGTIAGYEDAFGMSKTTGEDTGDVAFKASSNEQQDFYDRVNYIKVSYQTQGKTVDAVKVAAVYHVLKDNGANVTYDDMTDSAIREIVNSMFEGNSYNEETFKKNLISNIFPKYLPEANDKEKESMAREVFEYINDYYGLIGKGVVEEANACGTVENCNYEVKGFSVKGKGNVSENVQISNLYVRLMQCGIGNGHDYGGTFGKPLSGESLVPFEKYILGVAYQELGEDAPVEAIKAQMVASRSYILGRHVDLGGWRTLKKESSGKWVLQVAACSQDQVYCDPDQGCSSNDAEWGQVHSGLEHNNGFSKEPLSSTSRLRLYAKQTQGELLVNSQGYVVYTGYLKDDQKKFISLANTGLDYKQILLQTYNQGTRNYGVSDISRASCKTEAADCSSPSTASGDYVNWKQIEGPWINTLMGRSGKTIRQIGCLVTSIAIQIARAGVPTVILDFNPGTFVEFLNDHFGFDSVGNLQYYPISDAASNFHYAGSDSVRGFTREQKLSHLQRLLDAGYYVVAEVKGDTGQHWVAVDSIVGDTIIMMDPGSHATDMWSQYKWYNTSRFVYFSVG